MDWDQQQNDDDEDDDEDDEDFIPDEDDEDDEDDGGMLRFYDPSDTRFMGGFQLEHFLGPSTEDHINLRREESTEEDRLLNDNICQGLINSMLNSGNDLQVALAKEGLKRLEKQKRAREAKQAGKITKKHAEGKKSKQKKKKHGKHKKAEHAKR
ncbi:hypothetical protein BCR43DRAFT_484085 [Syncephalastrum racemosum]|uniref:Uncharacterized protein n=1 Tax=Syncephalastrum racemosum TaxID=13706 RepID=A0A1X2HW70_SYNRA|nr:hypothetical protein BCR43DRAFT_484085 [Syncephalastrum racemosum]